jgi:8-amino-7-oxononanoate synthase
MKMSKAESRMFKHNDVKHLERLLKEHRNEHSGALIVTEGVFSMDGDVPPLDEIMKLAHKYNARVLLDEAHSFGATGPTGLGCWETCPDDYPSDLSSCKPKKFKIPIYGHGNSYNI